MENRGVIMDKFLALQVLQLTKKNKKINSSMVEEEKRNKNVKLYIDGWKKFIK